MDLWPKINFHLIELFFFCCVYFALYFSLCTKISLCSVSVLSSKCRKGEQFRVHLSLCRRIFRNAVLSMFSLRCWREWMRIENDDFRVIRLKSEEKVIGLAFFFVPFFSFLDEKLSWKRNSSIKKSVTNGVGSTWRAWQIFFLSLLLFG